MQASRIIPDLQSSLICEQVRREINGNFIIIGVVSVIRVPQLPVVAGQLCVMNRWCAGVGEFQESARLIDPDQTTVIRQSEVKFKLNDPSHHATNVSVFGQIEFKTEGVYYIEVTVDDVLKLRYPLPVILQKPAGGQQAAG